MVTKATLAAEQKSLLERRLPSPAWERCLAEGMKEGSQIFLLHFNVEDVVFDPQNKPESLDQLLSVRDHLLLKLWRAMDVALYYSLTSGFEVWDPSAILPDAMDSSPGASGYTLAFDPKTMEPTDSWREIVKHARQNPYQLYEEQRSFFRPAPAPPECERVPGQAFRLFTRVLRGNYRCEDADAQDPAYRIRQVKVGLVVDHAEHLMPNSGGQSRAEVTELVEAVLHWARSDRLARTGRLAVFLSSSKHAVHPELYNADSPVKTVQLDRPTLEERQSFLEWLATQPELQSALDGVDTKTVATKSAGLNFSDLLALARDIARGVDWQVAITRRKDDVIQRESGGLLVPYESSWGYEAVAGYDYAKKQLEPVLEQLRERGRAVTPGILFAGPPGTGKSFLARALAHEAGMNMVRLGNILGSYVGDSERNFERALDVAQALHPVIVFIDEIDQAYGRRQGFSGDSGVSQRIFGRLLSFMDDKANLGKVLWIAATNRPDLLDDALLSRFRMIIPFLLPDKKACADMIRWKLPHQHGFEWQGEVPDSLVSKLAGRFSGRELEAVTVGALMRAHETKGQVVPGIPYDFVPVSCLQSVLDSSRVGHNIDMYTFQALLAIQRVLFPTPELIDGIGESLPGVAGEVLKQGRFYDEGLESKIQEYEAKARPYLR